MEGHPVRIEAQGVSDCGGRGGSRLFAGEEMSEPMRQEMLGELDKGTVIIAMIPEIRDAIRALIEEHGKLKEENIVLLERIENLKHSLEELAKENYKLKEGADEW